MTTYYETIRTLFELLYQANLADSESAEDWQEHDDANGRNGVYHHISKAIVILAGQEVLDRWHDSSEVDLTLCNREPSGEISESMIAITEMMNWNDDE